jgi:hypothetical protein
MNASFFFTFGCHTKVENLLAGQELVLMMASWNAIYFASQQRDLSQIVRVLWLGMSRVEVCSFCGRRHVSRAIEWSLGSAALPLSPCLPLCIGPWLFFQFLNPIHRRWDSWDGGSVRRKAAACTQNKSTQTSMPWVGFETTIPSFKRAKTVHVLDRTATVIATEDVLGSEIYSVVSDISDFDTICRWVINFTLRSFYPWRQDCFIPTD